jgi:hypothetical protein
MKFYKILCNFLYFSLFLIIAKFGYDYHILNKKNEIKKITENYKYKKEIDNPRIQVDGDNFGYVVATRGFVENENKANEYYIFENVDLQGDLLKIKADKLEIKNNRNIFEFTEYPKVKIYLDKLEKNK